MGEVPGFPDDDAAGGEGIHSDVSAGMQHFASTEDQTDMPATVAELGVEVIVGHLRGTPADMTAHAHYADVVAEVRATFERYEAALVANDLDVLDELFWDSAQTVRYGVNENLYGIDAIRDFRNARSAVGLARTLQRTVITTYGDDFGTAMTEFKREGG